MMKKLLAVTAVAGLVGAPAMAGTLTGAFDSNKYTETFGANAASTYTLDLSITVEKVASVWTDYSGVSLVLDGGATNEDSVRGTVKTINNFDAAVYATLNTNGGDGLPDDTQFIIVINPQDLEGNYDPITTNNYDNAIVWRRDDGASIAPDYGTSKFAYSVSATQDAVETTVDYYVDARHGLPAEGVSNLELVWTITAPTP